MSFPFVQLLVNSLIIGAIYALVAAGFSLIYSTNRFMHFAHGTAVAASAYIAYLFAVKLSTPFVIAVIATLLFAGLLGAAMYLLLYKPLQKRNASGVILLIASVGLLLLMENLILLLFGADVKSFSRGLSQTVHFLGATITTLQIVIIAVALSLIVLLYLLMQKTSLGKQMRAVSDNKALADISGIDSNKICLIAFIIGSGLAGIAGVLVGLEQNLEPTMGTSLMIKGFTGAVIGGVTSVPAAILGSFFLGAAENFGIWWLPSGYKDAIAFGLLFIFLLWRPYGLFGSKGSRV